MSRQPARATHPALLCTALAVALALLCVAEAAGSGGERTLRYWTPERMANARPLDLVLDRRGEPSSASAPLRRPAGAARRCPPALSPLAAARSSPRPSRRHHDNRDFDLGAFLTYPNQRDERLADAVGGGWLIAGGTEIKRPHLIRRPRPARHHLRPLLLARNGRQAGRRALSRRG